MSEALVAVRICAYEAARFAAPCVCRWCSRRFSTAAWHRCLFQFHLAALVIKSWTDTTHQITTVITSELHCVYKTITLSETVSPSPCLCPSCSLFLSWHWFVLQSSEAVRHLTGNKWLSFCSDSLNNFEYLMQNSSSAGQVVGVAEVVEIPEMRSPKLIQN